MGLGLFQKWLVNYCPNVVQDLCKSTFFKDQYIWKGIHDEIVYLHGGAHVACKPVILKVWDRTLQPTGIFFNGPNALILEYEQNAF